MKMNVIILGKFFGIIILNILSIDYNFCYNLLCVKTRGFIGGVESRLNFKIFWLPDLRIVGGKRHERECFCYLHLKKLQRLINMLVSWNDSSWCISSFHFLKLKKHILNLVIIYFLWMKLSCTGKESNKVTNSLPFFLQLVFRLIRYCKCCHFSGSVHLHR